VETALRRGELGFALENKLAPPALPPKTFKAAKRFETRMNFRDRALSSASAAAPVIVVLLLTGPILAGLAGTLIPAFGYFPALGGTGVNLDGFRTLLAEPGIWMSVFLSLLSGLAATALSLAITAAAIGAGGGTRTFAWLTRLISPLLAVPHAAAAFGFLFLFSPSGFLSRLISPELTGWMRPPDVLIPNDAWGLSLIAGLVLKEVPFLLLMALAARGQVKMAESRQLTASFGYGRLAGFVMGIWPQLYRRMRLPVFAVLAFSVSVVDVAAILGPTNPATLGMRLVGWMNDPDLSMRFAASAGAVLLIAVTVVSILIWLGLERFGALLLHWQDGTGRRHTRDGMARKLALSAAGLVALFNLAGLALLALWSVSGLWQFPDALPSGLTPKSWMAALPQISGPLATSVLTAVFASAVSLVLVVLVLLGAGDTGREIRAGQILLYAPLIAPQASFLFGLQLLVLGSSISISLPLLVFSHLIFVLPYVFLSLSDPWRGYDTRYERIASGLGRSHWDVFWKVRLAMLLRPVLTALAVGFAVSIGLYLPTVLIGAGRLPTITTEAVALASGGNRRVIGVYAFLQTALPFLMFLTAAVIPALLFRNRRAMRH
jgi:putative thiamine transport system permease protein